MFGLFNLAFCSILFSVRVDICAGLTCHCRNAARCQQFDGKCEDGVCAVGWTNSPFCQTACPAGSFGEGCSKTCRCNHGDRCDHVTGVCQSGRCLYGWGGASCQLELPRLLAPPRVQDVGSDHVLVTWPAWKRGYDPGHIAPSNYLLERGDGGHQWDVAGRFPAGQASYLGTVSGLLPRTRYNIRVTLQYNDDGKPVTSLPGSPTSFTTKCDHAPPPAPVGVTLRAEMSGNMVRLVASWKALPNSHMGCASISSYDVMICCTNDACVERTARVSGTQMSTVITAPYRASRAYVTVAAVNTAGLMGHRSKRVGVDIPTTLRRPAAPAPPGGVCNQPPEGLRTITEGSTKITFTWQTPRCDVKPSYYKVDLKQLEADTSGAPTEKQYAARDTSAILSGLQPGTQYSVAVTPVYRDLPGQATGLVVWTEPEDPPEIDSYPKVVEVTVDAMTLQLKPFKPSKPFSSIRVVIGQSLKPAQVKQGSPEVSQGSSRVKQGSPNVASKVSEKSQTKVSRSQVKQGSPEVKQGSPMVVGKVKAKVSRKLVPSKASMVRNEKKGTENSQIAEKPVKKHAQAQKISYETLDTLNSTLVNKQGIGGSVNSTGTNSLTKNLTSDSVTTEVYNRQNVTSENKTSQFVWPQTEHGNITQEKVSPPGSVSENMTSLRENITSTISSESGHKSFPSRRKRESASPPGSRDLPFNPDGLQVYDWTGDQEFYITAELLPGVVEKGGNFTIGDGKYYGKYYNAPLRTDSHEYVVFFGVVVVAGDKTKAKYTQVVPAPSTAHSPRSGSRDEGMEGWAVALLVIFLLLVVLGLVVIAVLVYRRHRQHFPARYSDLITYHRTHSTQAREVSMLTSTPSGGEKYNASVAMSDNMMTLPPKSLGQHLERTGYEAEGNSSVISTKHFVTYFDDKVRCEQTLQYEYNTLPRGFTACHNTAEQPSNILKNRSPSVVPYDKNRAVLIKSRDCDSDYINASVIKLSDNKTYIATQAPLATGVSDMWRLVWDHDVTNVVMLMDVKEKNKPEADIYWPLDGQVQCYKNITVKSLHTEMFADMTSRLFRLNRYGYGGGRLVRHLQYHVWGVGGVPLHTIPFLQFIRKVERHTKSGDRVVVQCHTGGGRCGMFIAVDHLISAGKESGRVDVYKCATKLRLERVQLVSTLAQYRFVHACLAECFSRISTLVLNDAFRSYHDNILHDAIGRHSYVLSAEFDDLKRYDKAMGLRSQTLPVGLSTLYSTPSRPPLVTTDALRSLSVSQRRHGPDYDVMLDAYYVDSYLRRDAFLLTQTPVTLQHAQFLDIVYNSKAVCVLSCDVAVDGSTVWPSRTLTRQIGPYSVTNHREMACEVGMYMRVDLSLELGTDDSARNIRHYQMCNWPQGSPAPSVEQLLEMYHDMFEYLGDSGSPSAPVVIHCTDAVTRSALLVTCWILLQKAEVEGEVDLYRTAKYMRHNAPGCLPTMEHYKFCYSFLSHYIKRGKFCHQSPAPADHSSQLEEVTPGGNNITQGSRTPQLSGSKGSSRSTSAKRRLSAIFRSGGGENDGKQDRSGGKQNRSGGKQNRSGGKVVGSGGKSSSRKQNVSFNNHMDSETSTSYSPLCIADLAGDAESPAAGKPRSCGKGNRTGSGSRAAGSPVAGKRPSTASGGTGRGGSIAGSPAAGKPPNTGSAGKGRGPSTKKRRAPPRPDSIPPPIPAVYVHKDSPPPMPSVSPPHRALSPAAHGVSPSVRPSPLAHRARMGASPAKSDTPEQGLVGVLTPHSKIAKARRVYFGLNSPVTKGAAPEGAPGGGGGGVTRETVVMETTGVRKKLFVASGQDEGSRDQTVSEMQVDPVTEETLDSSSDSSSDSEWEEEKYSMSDISAEMHAQPASELHTQHIQSQAAEQFAAQLSTTKKPTSVKSPMLNAQTKTTQKHAHEPAPSCTKGTTKSAEAPDEAIQKPCAQTPPRKNYSPRRWDFSAKTASPVSTPSPKNTTPKEHAKKITLKITPPETPMSKTANSAKHAQTVPPIDEDRNNQVPSVASSFMEKLAELKRGDSQNSNLNNCHVSGIFPEMSDRAVSLDDVIHELKNRSRSLQRSKRSSGGMVKAQSCDNVLTVSSQCDSPICDSNLENSEDNLEQCSSRRRRNKSSNAKYPKTKTSIKSSESPDAVKHNSKKIPGQSEHFLETELCRKDSVNNNEKVKRTVGNQLTSTADSHRIYTLNSASPVTQALSAESVRNSECADGSSELYSKSYERVLSGVSQKGVQSSRSNESVLSGVSQKGVQSSRSHESVLSGGSQECVGGTGVQSSRSYESVISARGFKLPKSVGAVTPVKTGRYMQERNNNKLLPGNQTSSEQYLQEHSNNLLLSNQNSEQYLQHNNKGLPDNQNRIETSTKGEEDEINVVSVDRQERTDFETKICDSQKVEASELTVTTEPTTCSNERSRNGSSSNVLYSDLDLVSGTSAPESPSVSVKQRIKDFGSKPPRSPVRKVKSVAMVKTKTSTPPVTPTAESNAPQGITSKEKKYTPTEEREVAEAMVVRSVAENRSSGVSAIRERLEGPKPRREESNSTPGNRTTSAPSPLRRSLLKLYEESNDQSFDAKEFF